MDEIKHGHLVKVENDGDRMFFSYHNGGFILREERVGWGRR